jgi:hypothetical protein
MGACDMKRTVILLCIAALCIAVAVAAAAPRANQPQPGQTPTDPLQLARIKNAREQLVIALQEANPDAIARAETGVRQALGPYAGVPEAREELNPRGTKATRPSRADFRKLTERMGQLASGSEEAKKNRMELRHAAYLAIGLLDMSEAQLPDAAKYRTQSAIELDYLISKQASAGYFPYPVNPVAPPHLQRKAAKVAKEYPEKVKNGFIYLDADGAQFDTGCAAYALAYGYQILKEDRYLKAARKAGDWALQFPLSANWNYNSFSVWQLAKLTEVTGDRKYRNGAVRAADLGVLPGQMETGRWSDQHNARAVYHWIMVRALVELIRVLPDDDHDKKHIAEKTRLAIQTRVDDVLREGGENNVHAYVALAQALDVFGPNRRWEQALTEISGGNSPYAAGVFARRWAAVGK